MQPDVLDMLRDDVRTADVRRQRNRERFPFAAEMLDALKAGGIDARIVYADNADGESVGKRDPGPFFDWTLIERAKRWNDRVYGREAVQPDAAPKRRAMTDAQRACLRGDVCPISAGG